MGGNRRCTTTVSARRLAIVGLAIGAALAVAGCSSLPEDGPSARQVAKQADKAKTHYALVDVDYRVAQIVEAHPSTPLTSLTVSPDAGPSDLIAVGDSLSISIFVPSLGFSPEQGPNQSSDQNNGPQTLPRVIVDRNGAIHVPFAGETVVAGLTPEGAAAAIRRGLHGKVANPQVIVTSVLSPRNSVIVIGEVKNPGRYPLAPNSDRLLDAVAEAGGPTKPARDLALTVVRGDQSATISVATLLEDPGENIRLSPQDQIRILSAPRKVDVFGAVGKGAQIPIEDDTLTVAGALARIGGLNPVSSDAKSVLIFRFERVEVAKALGVTTPEVPGLTTVPIIYRVNLRDPSGYFIANKFDVAANDLIYVPTADAAEFQKFLLIVNSAAQFFYDAAVTKTLGL